MLGEYLHDTFKMLSDIDINKVMFTHKKRQFQCKSLNEIIHSNGERIPTYDLLELLFLEIETLNTHLSTQKEKFEKDIQYYKKLIKQQYQIDNFSAMRLQMNDLKNEIQALNIQIEIITKKVTLNVTLRTRIVNRVWNPQKSKSWSIKI